MVEWYVLLSPLLLLPIVLLFAFVGCNANLSGPTPRVNVRVDLGYRSQELDEHPGQPDEIVLSWRVFTDAGEIVEDGELLEDCVREFSDDFTHEIYSFLISDPVPGSWRMWCAYYTTEEEPEERELHFWEEAECSFSVREYGVDIPIGFEISPDGAEGWRVQFVQDG